VKLQSYQLFTEHKNMDKIPPVDIRVYNVIFW